MKRLNKKGFTLVELLAVIVILALIMAIAIYSISGILQSSRESVFKETGLNVLNGVKNQLMANNELREGTYYFTKALLDNDNDLPFGGKISYQTTFTDMTGIGTSVTTGSGASATTSYPVYRAKTAGTCPAPIAKTTGPSFVTVTYEGGQFKFSLCLIPTPVNSATQRYINNASEAELLGNSTDKIAAVKMS